MHSVFSIYHFLLLKRYATANNPAIADTTSNPGTGVGLSVAVVVGDGVEVGVGVCATGIDGVGVIGLITLKSLLNPSASTS